MIYSERMAASDPVKPGLRLRKAELVARPARSGRAMPPEFRASLAAPSATAAVGIDMGARSRKAVTTLKIPTVARNLGGWMRAFVGG